MGMGNYVSKAYFDFRSIDVLVPNPDPRSSISEIWMHFPKESADYFQVIDGCLWLKKGDNLIHVYAPGCWKEVAIDWRLEK